MSQRNLVDLLSGLGFRTVDDGGEHLVITCPSFKSVQSSEEVWEAAKALRASMMGAAKIDPDFELGAIVDYSEDPPKRPLFLEAQPATVTITGHAATLTMSPPSGLTAEELEAWERERAEREYQASLEAQLANLVPAHKEPRAEKVLELLGREQQTGETLFKIYELAKGSDSESSFLQRVGETKMDFDRFSDAVHNAAVSGDLARHATHQKPRTTNPMTMKEAEVSARRVARSWLNSLR